MYEKYTRQALPLRRYRELLGSAVCVFNSNNSFIIENILRLEKVKHNWYDLIDANSGDLLKLEKDAIPTNFDSSLCELFTSIVLKRNRIVHSFQVTVNGEQVLATKARNGEQFVITEEYLIDFIRENERLSMLLHEFRGY